jgi:alanine racemase
MSEAACPVARVTMWPHKVAANFVAMKKLAGPAAAVVKADAYGLGLAGVLPALQDAGCDSFFVARLEEGLTLRALLDSKRGEARARIFVLDGAPPDAIPALMSHALIPVLGSLADIAAWQRAARGWEAAIHVDTGMNRLGLPGEELSVLVAQASSRMAGLKLVLVMSHLACSDDPDDPMNTVQLGRFKSALALLPAAPASLAASGGVMLGRDYHFDLVRPGLALYGGNPQPGHPSPVQAAVRLSGQVLQLRRIDKGKSVGYGAAFHAQRPSMIATVALGYADGVLRAAAHKGVALVRGARAPFAGRVSMDLSTLDVTDIAEVAVGDEAELFGPALSLEEAASGWGTNAYELLTGLSRRAARVYLGTG